MIDNIKDTVPVSRWLHSPPAKSKRHTQVADGLFVLEHDATGRFYIGVNKDVSATVDKQIAALSNGKHPCKLLNHLYARDNIIRVHEYSSASKRKTKLIIKNLLEHMSNDKMCLNPNIQ